MKKKKLVPKTKNPKSKNYTMKKKIKAQMQKYFLKPETTDNKNTPQKQS